MLCNNYLLLSMSMIKKLTDCVYMAHCKVVCVLNLLKPLIALFIRLYLANIFIKSGLVKINDWQATLFLFQNEYKVPLLPYELAAILATTMELVIAPMLAIGLATRYSAILLLIMTIVMNYTYQHAAENYYWMTLFMVLIAYGGSKLSVDYLIKRKCCSGTAMCPCCNCYGCNDVCSCCKKDMRDVGMVSCNVSARRQPSSMMGGDIGATMSGQKKRPFRRKFKVRKFK